MPVSRIAAKLTQSTRLSFLRFAASTTAIADSCRALVIHSTVSSGTMFLLKAAESVEAEAALNERARLDQHITMRYENSITFEQVFPNCAGRLMIQIVPVQNCIKCGCVDKRDHPRYASARCLSCSELPFALPDENFPAASKARCTRNDLPLRAS
jgi:hypothetical protein